MKLTYFGANSWLWQWENHNILVDPWLNDDLVFGNQRWFFRGIRNSKPTLPEQIDLLLLSQGLPDHAHRPTLNNLDKTIPVVGSPSAAQVAKTLGFETVTPLAHGEIYTLGNSIEIRALPGALVGFEKENAFILTALSSQQRLYYEPHGFPSKELWQYAPIEVVINPIVNLELPLAGPIINGQDSVIQLAEGLQPKAILPTASGGDIEYQGMLVSWLKTVGSIEQARSRLQQRQLSTEIMDLQQEEPIVLLE